ncbi:MAG TPA: hypothetical protein HA257_02625 [Candidatus Methanoperedenaceae archaeon]|nr:hypothetical protein [Candidatus Methanoperedenaceae archaeon]
MPCIDFPDPWQSLNKPACPHFTGAVTIIAEFTDRAKAQLQMIEAVYGIRITNIDTVARLIGEDADNEREVLAVCSALNSWVFFNHVRGAVELPVNVVKSLRGKINRHT